MDVYENMITDCSNNILYFRSILFVLRIRTSYTQVNGNGMEDEKEKKRKKNYAASKDQK